MASPPAQTILRGQVATTDRIADIQPEHWISEIYRYESAGTVPMLAIQDRMPQETTPATVLHWPEQDESTQFGTVTDVYTNASLSTAYTSGGVVGSVEYIKMTAAYAKQLNVGDIITIYSPSVGGVGVAGRVENVVVSDDSNSYAAIKLMRADSGPILDNSDLVWFTSSNSHREGAELPDAIAYEPTYYSNQTQIFMASCEATGTTMANLERVSPKYWDRQVRAALMDLKMKMDWSNIWGVYGTTYENGKPNRTHMGLLEAMRTHLSSPYNFFDFPTTTTITGDPFSTSFAGMTWAEGGWTWFRTIMELISRNTKPGTVKQVYCGPGAMEAISRLVEARTNRVWTSEMTEFGLECTKLSTLNCKLVFMLHPRMVKNSVFHNHAFVTEMRNVHQVTLKGRGLKFISGLGGDNAEAYTDGYAFVDGRKAGWICERSIRWNNLTGFAYLTGLGMPNTQ